MGENAQKSFIESWDQRRSWNNKSEVITNSSWGVIFSRTTVQNIFEQDQNSE